MESNVMTPTSPDGLSRYLTEIRKYPYLDAKTEQELAECWCKHGDPEAVEQLVASHLRLVAKIARDFQGYGMPLSDLISEGSVGLMQAAQKFDPDLGHRFSTYAMWWIRAAIQEYVLRSSSMVRLGTTAAQKKLFFGLRRRKAQHKELGSGDMAPETVAAIAKELGVLESEVVEMNRRLMGGEASLNATLTAESGDEWIDLLEDETQDPEALAVDSDELHKRRLLLRDALDQLSERERHILSERRLSDDPPTLEELSQVYKISRERVRQIEVAAFAKVKKLMSKKDFAQALAA